MKYSNLVAVYKELDSTPKRLEKTRIISELIRKTAQSDLHMVIQLIQGRIFPSWDRRTLGVASKTVLKAIGLATGIRKEKIEESWKKTGDLGLTARELTRRKKQTTLLSNDLEVNKVYNNLLKLAGLTGQGTIDRKTKLVAELLTSADPDEAQYITRTVLEDLRLGVGEGSLRDAIAWAYFSESLKISYDPSENKLTLPDNSREEYKAHIEAIQGAYDRISDFGEIAAIISKDGLKGLKKLNIEPGRPIKVMLVQKAKDPSDALEKVGRPAAFEYKYDGFRLQIHINKNDIRLFTRRLEDVTAQFPDVVEAAKEQVRADSAILDSEAVGIDKKTGKYLPFQKVSQRIKRKHDIKKITENFPVEVNVFDLLFYDGKGTLKQELGERRAVLERIIKPLRGKIILSRQLVTDDAGRAEKFYREALKKGNEGLIAKSTTSIYKPGSRVGFWVKIKPVMKSLELAIVSAEWGEGKRGGWLTSFTLACRDSEGNLLEIGRVSTGVKELSSEGTSYEDMTNLLTPLILSEKGRSVTLKPEMVIEVNYEEIQRSPTYSSGYALRFPRFIRLRDDRSTDDIDSIGNVEELYRNQRNR